MILNPHPIAKACWEKAVSTCWDGPLATLKAEQPESAEAVRHVIDLAREHFFEVSDGSENHPDYPEVAVELATDLISLFVLEWTAEGLRQRVVPLLLATTGAP